MKYKFLLDENVIYHAIQRRDKFNNFDLTAAKLLVLIAKNCHSIVIDSTLWKSYHKILARLKSEKSDFVKMIMHIHLLLSNSEKSMTDFQTLPELTDETIYPRKDIYVVRAAYHFSAVIVTSDSDLTEAINIMEHASVKALHPEKALKLARET